MARDDMTPYDYAFYCIGGKWKAAILMGIYKDGHTHFNAMKKQLIISEKVLNQILKEFIEKGILQKRVISEKPLNIEYFLTPLGVSLIPVIQTVYDWGRIRMLENSIPIDPLIEKYHGY